MERIEIICDLCGKPISYRENTIETRSIKRTFAVDWNKRNKEYDLCDKCFNKFIKSLNSKEKGD